MESEYMRTKLEHEVYKHPLNKMSRVTMQILDYEALSKHYIKLELKRLTNQFGCNMVWDICKGQSLTYTTNTEKTQSITTDDINDIINSTFLQ
jgi:hypothetical protein